MRRILLLALLAAGPASGQDGVLPDSAAAGSMTTGITRPGEETSVSGLRVAMQPGSGEVRLLFSLERPADVRLDIYDSRGRMVHCGLYRYYRKGDKVIAWQGGDVTGVHGGTGHYIYSFNEGDAVRTGMFFLVRN